MLVEGKRDAIAVRALGYRGRILTVSILGRRGSAALHGVEKVVILTDLDREGALLTSRYLRFLTHEGIVTSLGERRRLRLASRGVFLHIENLGRFSKSEFRGLEADGPSSGTEDSRGSVTKGL